VIFIRYYENIIVDESVDMELSQLKFMIDEGIAIHNIYIIGVSSMGNGIMEILSTKDLIKTVNSKKNYGIIAIAKGRKNINDIMCFLVQDWIDRNKDLSFFKNYYNRRCY